MNTTEETKEKLTPIARMTKKLDDIVFIEKQVLRLKSWSELEADSGKSKKLALIAKTLGEIESRRKDIVEELLALSDENYTPPKAKVIGTSYEKGDQVWIKEAKLSAYSKLYTKAQLNNLVVDNVVEARVAVTFGGEGTAFFIPKLHLTTVNPSDKE